MTKQPSSCSSTKVSTDAEINAISLMIGVNDEAGIFDSLAGLLVVDELEEDGSGMYYSDDSSVASSNTAG